jgi:hypothetical protein
MKHESPLSAMKIEPDIELKVEISSDENGENESNATSRNQFNQDSAIEVAENTENIMPRPIITRQVRPVRRRNICRIRSRSPHCSLCGQVPPPANRDNRRRRGHLH